MADYKNLKSEKLKTDVLIIGGGTAVVMQECL